MKDLTSAKAFADQTKRMNRIVSKRMVDINDYDEFLVELADRKKEANQEHKEDFMVDGYSDRYSQERFETNQFQRDNFEDSINKLKDDFEPNEIDSSVQNTQMSVNQSVEMKPSLLSRITLNLRDNLSEYFEEQETYYQDKSEIEQKIAHKTRLLSEWNSLLYSARILGGTALGAIVNALVAIPAFKIFPATLLCGALTMYLIENKKLMRFNDGIFRGNLKLDNSRIAPLAKKNRKELYAVTNNNEEEKNQDVREHNTYNDDDDLTFDSNDNSFSLDDSQDDEYTGLSDIFGDVKLPDELTNGRAEDTEDDESDNERSKHLLAKPVKETLSPNSDFVKSLCYDESTLTPQNIAESEITFEDGKYETKIFHEQARKIYKEFYENRKELGKKAKTRKQIFRTFAPIVAKFNKNFGEFTPVDNESNVVKNLAYTLFLAFSEISPKFRKITENDFDPDYYVFIGNCTETALYYKFDFKLPSLISLDNFKNKLSVVERYLKSSSNDNSVELSIEQKEDGGSLKIFKVRYIRDKGNLLPVVSTGDVLRFKGMKIYGNDVVEDLTGAGDYRCFLGLREGEYPAIQDWGATQNTGLSIIGGSGSGKTFTIVSLLLNAMLIYPPEEVGIIIMDKKGGKELREFKKLPHVLGYFDQDYYEQYSEILEIIGEIRKTRGEHLTKDVKTDKSNYAEARAKYSKNMDWEKIKQVPRLIVICDEQFSLLESLRSLDDKNADYNRNKDKEEPKKSTSNYNRYKNAIADLAATVREIGITMILISQRSTDNAIPKSFMTAGASMHLWMRCDDEKDFLRYNEGSTRKVGGLPTGTGYFYANGEYSNGIKVNSTLTCGSPEANNEFMLLVCYLWNILQANRGYDMFDETIAFGFKQLDNSATAGKTNPINRPKSVVEVAKELYIGDVFAEDIGEKKMSIDIVDDILENISEESKHRFPKEYCDLVEIKYPEKAKVLRKELEVHATTAKEAIEREQKEEKPQLNDFQLEMQKNMNNAPAKIEDDNDMVGVGEEIADNAFISDSVMKEKEVYGSGEEVDDEELLAGERAEINRIKNMQAQEQKEQEENDDESFDEETSINEEPNVDDFREMFGKAIVDDDSTENRENKNTPSVVEKHLGEEVDDKDKIIDDGRFDKPQNAKSIEKYCKAHNLETVQLTELKQIFSENAINSAVSNNILLSDLTDGVFIFTK